jgi:hypothetical protein
MSHKKSNENLRDQRLLGELTTALDSAAWSAEAERQRAWTEANRADNRPDPIDDAGPTMWDKLGDSQLP